jgi:hypothetical protein
MSDWVLIPCLKTLFAEFDRIAPSRDKASDGSIGNAAHEQEVSDHNPDETGSVPIHDVDKTNEVHAIDVDTDFRESDLSMEKVVQFLLGRCRSGAEKRLRYIIYYRRIWSASSGWVQKAYTGPSAHTEHAHFSASYDSNLEASTASWHLEDIPVAMTAADKAWIQAQNAQLVKDLKAAMAADNPTTGWSSGYPGRTDAQHKDDLQVVRNYVVGHPDSKGQQIPEDSPLVKIAKAADIIIAGNAGASSGPFHI